MKKTIVWLLTLVMLLSLMAGCASEPATTPSTDTPATSEPADTTPSTPAEEPAEEPIEAPAEEPAEEPTDEPAEDLANIYAEDGRIMGAQLPSAIAFPLAEPKTYTIFASNFIDKTFNFIESMADNMFYQKMAEMTNVTLEFTTPSGAASREQFNLMLVSEDYTNLIRGFYGSYGNGVDHAIEEGIIYALEDYAEYYPNYQAIRDAREDVRMDTISDEGHVWGFASIMTEEQGAWTGPMIRGDLLKKYNLDVPVTFADWEECLTAFKQEPGMENGPFHMSSSFFSNFYSWSGGFNCGGLSTFNNENGTVSYSVLTDGYKDAVALMRDWWEKGLVYRDFLSKGLFSFDIVASGEVAIWEGPYDLTIYPAMVDPALGWEFMPISQPLVSEDQETHFRQCQPYTGPGNAEVITTVTEEEDVKILCAYLDTFYRRDIVHIANWGEEGLTYTYDENGKPVFTDLIAANPDADFLTCNEIYLGGRNMPGVYEWTREITNEGTQQCLDAWSAIGCDWVYPSCATMNAEEAYEFSSMMSDIQTFVEENVAAFVFGEKNMDADWDKFIETIYSMDIERAIELKQNQLDRYYGRLD